MPSRFYRIFWPVFRRSAAATTAVASKSDADREDCSCYDAARSRLEMATCPRCLGPLTENHRCPRGRFHRVGDAVMTVAVGGAIGAVAVFALEERPAGALVLAAAALGAVLTNAVRQAL